jgi:hypothetical protein
MKKPRYGLGLIALAVGCLVNYAGDWILGVRVEIFYGIAETFNFRWFLQIFVLPVFVGYAVTYVYGLGGKWLSYFPPLIVRFIAYYETMYVLGVPKGALLMPLGWWGFFVILAIECAAIGGVVGEVVIKRIYGRSTKPPEVAPATADTNSADPK